MSAFLSFLGRHALTAMVAGVFIGLLVPPLATVMRPFLAPSVWLLLLVSLLRMDPREGLNHLSQPGRLSILLFCFLVILPMAMYGLLSLTALPPGIVAAMVLAAGSSVLISTPTFALLMRLDGAIVLLIMLGSTLLLPLTLPTVALVLLGLHLEINNWELMGRLVLLLGSALIFATIGRRIFGEVKIKNYSSALDGAAVIILIIFAIAIMDGFAERLITEPVFVLFVILMSFLVYLGLLIFVALALFLIVPKWGARENMSIAFAAGARNLAVIFAVLPSNVDPDMLVYFAAGQFPIYIMPAILRPIMVRLVKAPIDDKNENSIPSGN